LALLGPRPRVCMCVRAARIHDVMQLHAAAWPESGLHAAVL